MTLRTREWESGLRLFAFSFVALFLELMIIRWVPAVVPVVAYYANLMLISSFLGLGLGAMLARRKRDLIPYFFAITALNIAVLVVCRQFIGLPEFGVEARFASTGSLWINCLILIAVFVLNVAMFIPLGQSIGRLFTAMPPLRAYACDLGGSLCGTLAFGAFSLFYFSPIIGFALIGAIYLLAIRGSQRLWTLPFLALVLLLVPFSTSRQAFWSPYYYVLVHPWSTARPPVDQPVPDLRNRFDPPLYFVSVNTNFYQLNGTLDLRRYTPGHHLAEYVQQLDSQYFLPHRIHPNAAKVCVVGAGGGMDVQAALLSGAESVDAVEIDPTLVNISRRFSAAGVYDDPRVSVHINDARAFLQSATGPYDMVVFGFLDSQALFSYSSNIRLDGYIYTVQSIRKAYSLLKPDGLLSISFAVGKPWLGDKLKGMIRQATGQSPLVYTIGLQYVMCVSPAGNLASAPATIGSFKREDTPIPAMDLPTDDWPFLYLAHRTIPPDYLIIIGSLLALSIAMVFTLRHFDATILHGASNIAQEGHFFALGVAFLLLETKSIGDCSLYFGTTWFVTMVVVTGVLLMVFMANLLAMRLPRTPMWMYLPLLASLAGLYLIPRDQVLGLPVLARLLWSILIVPLPIFFAGLIFSTTFRSASDPALVLGANLIGATVGGFLEYAGMALGTRSLGLFVIAAYLISFVCLKVSRRAAHQFTPINGENTPPQSEATMDSQ